MGAVLSHLVALLLGHVPSVALSVDHARQRRYSSIIFYIMISFASFYQGPSVH